MCLIRPENLTIRTIWALAARIFAGCARLRALWTKWSVEVRVLSGASKEPLLNGGFCGHRCIRPRSGRSQTDTAPNTSHAMLSRSEASRSGCVGKTVAFERRRQLLAQSDSDRLTSWLEMPACESRAGSPRVAAPGRAVRPQLQRDHLPVRIPVDPVFQSLQAELPR